MQLIDGQPVFSATDLVGYLACEHLTNLERAAMAGRVPRPERDDPELDVIRRRGEEHERRYLAELEAADRRATRITMDGSATDHGDALRRAAEETREAILRGDEVIYQATFFDGRWRGHADFLLRVDGPSAIGPWSYEVADTKLAHHVKGSALLQICSYVEQLTAIQGVVPEKMHVALGGSARAVEQFRVADYMAYYRAVKARFEAAAFAGTPTYPPANTYPEPVDHCEVCRWIGDCQRRRRADDHLSLVAGITGHQRRALSDRAVSTVERLGVLELPMVPPLEGVGTPALQRVQHQARIQVEGRRAGRHRYELLPMVAEFGLASLPPPSHGDLFFDIEGDPYAFDEGIEYLFGVIDPAETDADGQPKYLQLWATDPDQEKRAFEELIDLFVDRLDHDPELHIFHYAAYEPTAMKRLMGRHGTREAEVDRLLRGGVFVDLFRAVRQGLRASVESYSLKTIEPLYGFTRTVELQRADSSIVEFERWLELRDEAPLDRDAILRGIADYNRDDCLSTWRLRDWLEERRVELEAQIGEPVPRPGPRDPEPGAELTERLARVQALTERLTSDIGVDGAELTPDQRARWLLAQLLSWHRREDKSFWWLWYYLSGLTDAERIEESEPIGGLVYERIEREEKRSYVHRYRFPPQEHDIRRGGGNRDPATGESAGVVVAVDEEAGVLLLKRGKTSAVPHPTSLIPFEYYGQTEQEKSLFRIGDWVAEHGVDAPGPYLAARDLLLGRIPRVGQLAGLPLALPDETGLEAARRLALRLDHTSLAIQGPPGSGKTYTGARMILDLVRAGRRVGITATSHKVIGNLLDEVMRAAIKEGVHVAAMQKADPDQACQSGEVRRTDDAAAVRDALAAGEINVAAGTAWVWAREDFIRSVDILFVDEAGQMSLANTIAVASAADNLVLLGDPLQLEQPLHGVHPPGAGGSALAHALGAATTMPPERGLFLERTWRLHPDLCGFTSEAFYESRLDPQPNLSAQRLNVAMTPFTAAATMLLDGTGIRYLPVPHAGNQNQSVEEAQVVAGLVTSLVDSGATWTDAEGALRRIGYADILVVAPYNLQVAAIRALLPAEARVGTVDKFQGQEAPVSIYSMASSTPDDAPRGMNFLYSRHRLNVATSRARCVSVLVCSPDLLEVRARSPVQMRLANAFAQLQEHAVTPAGPSPVATDAALSLAAVRGGSS